MYKENPLTSYRIELRDKILKASMHEFLQKGVKAVKMDDIANALGISKRTLYEVYSNKEELLLEGLRKHEEAYDMHMSVYSADPSHNVIDIVIEFLRIQVRNFSDVTPAFFSDLHKYKKVVDLLEEKRACRNKYTGDFFKRGVEEGYFRNDVDYEMMLRLGSVSMDYVMREQLYKVSNLKHIFRNIIFLFLRGVCTTEGIKRLDEFIDNELLVP